jgi:hypothetical protein
MAVNNSSDQATPNLRRGSEAKDVAFWLERVQIAKKALEDWAESSGAKRFIKEYKGDYGIVFHTRNKKIPIPPINEVFAYVQADVATTYNRDPYISVNPHAGSPRGAAFWEVILNYYWRHLETKEELEYEIIDKDLVGFGWHKVGTNNGRLYSNYVSWKDVVWNIGAKRPPLDCTWMAHRIVRPLYEIKRSFPASKTLEGTPNPDVNEETYKRSAYKDDIKVAVLWEVWNLEDRTKFLLAEGLKDRYLEKPTPWPEYLTRFPFRMYWDFCVPGSPFPMSAIAPWEPQILEEMVLMGQAINHSKRWNRQLFIKGGTVDDNALDKFERGDDGAIITVNASLDDAAFKMADFGQLPTDFYLLMDRLQAIKRNINGQPDFVRGGVTKTNTRTIGELQLMQKGAQGRQDRKIDRLETHCENIAKDMMAHLKANFDFEESVKITGETPQDIIAALGDAYDPVTGTVTFTPKDIAGEYDVEIKSGSTLPLDKETKLQMEEIILQNIAPIIAQGAMNSPFLNALIQDMLRSYDIKALEEAYAEEVQAAEQAKQDAQGQQSIEDEKTAAEAAKRQAQAKQIDVETITQAQEAALGPVGRAQIERLKKPEPKTPVGARS